MKLPKLPNLFKGKKSSRSSSLAGSPRSPSLGSSFSGSSRAGSPPRTSSEIVRPVEIGSASPDPGVFTGETSAVVTHPCPEIGNASPVAAVFTGESSSAVITNPSPGRHLEHRELSNAFKLIDVNEDGKISPSELGSMLSSLGYTSSEDELRSILEAVDTDGDGFIDLQEFITHNIEMDKAGSPVRTRELRAAFNVFDIDKNNFISAEELHQVLKGLGEKSTMEECSRMIRGVDSDGDGQVNFEEFEIMMRSALVH